MTQVTAETEVSKGVIKGNITGVVGAAWLKGKTSIAIGLEGFGSRALWGVPGDRIVRGGIVITTTVVPQVAP